jgi:hypothetical protein
MKRLLTLLLVTILSSCGGGGGGGGGSDTNFAGDLSLDLERDNLDSGDLTQVRIEVRDLNKSGAILKIRSSTSLRYVRNTAVLFPDRDEELRITPSTDQATDNERYLVFFLSSEDALGGDFIQLELTMKATKGDDDAFIELDLDNNDSNIPDSKEFSVESPRFSAVVERGLYIARDASEPTPTPVPSGTAAAQ